MGGRGEVPAPGGGGGGKEGRTAAGRRCSVGLKTVFNRRRYSSFSISVLEYIPVCFCWFSFLVQFHVPSRVCIDSLFESLFWRMSVLYLLVKFFDFFSWFTAVIFFFQRLYDRG